MSESGNQPDGGNLCGISAWADSGRTGTAVRERRGLLYSRLLGYGEKETANKAASTALYGSLLAGAVMIVCALLFLEPVLILLGATESILPMLWPMRELYGLIYIQCL